MTKRDIKFRLWDGRRLRPWEEISMFHMYCFDEDMTKKNDVWEQYTGLKDVNGVEIYEGDILSEVNFPILYIVKWDEKCAHFYCEPVGEWGEWKTFDENPADYYEVIGNIHENIHENPELSEV